MSHLIFNVTDMVSACAAGHDVLFGARQLVAFAGWAYSAASADDRVQGVCRQAVGTQAPPCKRLLRATALLAGGDLRAP